VSAVAPRVARRTGTGAAVRRHEPESIRARDAAGIGARGEGPERFDPLPPDRRADAPVTRADDPYGLRSAQRRPRVRIAILTGMLAFLAAVAVVTASELALFGGSVSGERGRTTIFGGQQKAGDDAERRPDRDATPAADPNEQATPEPTPSPAPEDEDEAAPEPTPSSTPTPAAPEATPSPAPTP
jgi:hypothetical protein